MKIKKCSVEGCPYDAHSRGLCRRHYGRLWRGRPLEGPMPAQEAQPSFGVDSLERQLADARHNHELVVGLEGRVRWRRAIQELEQALSSARQRISSQQAVQPETHHATAAAS